MRRSLPTCCHGVPVGLNPNYGEQPSEPRRPISTHIVPFCFAVLPCILFCGVCHCKRMPCYSSCACAAALAAARPVLVTARSGVGFHLPVWRKLCQTIQSLLPSQCLSSGVIMHRTTRDLWKDGFWSQRLDVSVPLKYCRFSWVVVMVTGTHDWELMMLQHETKAGDPPRPSSTLDALFPRHQRGREGCWGS